MKQKGLSNTTLAVIVIVVLVALYFIFKGGAVNEELLDNSSVTQDDGIKITLEDKKESANLPVNDVVEAPKEVSKYDDAKVSSCVSTYETEQDKYNTKYAYGYILVGFPVETSIDSAKEIIQSHGLTPRETSVGFHSYLYADVKVEQEFLWACRLKQDERIRYAEPSSVNKADI